MSPNGEQSSPVETFVEGRHRLPLEALGSPVLRTGTQLIRETSADDAFTESA